MGKSDSLGRLDRDGGEHSTDCREGDAPRPDRPLGALLVVGDRALLVL